MFNFFKKPPGEKIEIKLSGLHCTSCALNIDDALEELDGIYQADTNFPKSFTTIYYNPQKISLNRIHHTIKSLGYSVTK